MKSIIVIVSIVFLVSCNATQKKRVEIDRNICNTVTECLGAIKTVVDYNWKEEPTYGPGLKTKVLLELDDNFNAVKVEVVNSSGSVEFDRSAIRAINKSSPFVELRGLIDEDYQKFKSMSFVFAPDR